jgi:hypothetical protein
MKIGRFSLSGVSLALLIVQLLLVCSIAAKYLYQRWTCPRVWTRAIAYDPEMPMRGRYLALQLMVDGCESTLPSAKMAAFPRDVTGAVKPGVYLVRPQPVEFRADLKVENNKLIALRIEGAEDSSEGEEISAMPGGACDQMHLASGTDFFVAQHAQSPLPLKPGQELWIEVTIPPKGPPRAIQLALKDNGAWRPLGLE